MKKMLTAGIVLSCLLTSMAAMARPPMGEGGPRGHRGPPPEAIEACAAVHEGAACSFSGRFGETLHGSCETVRHGEVACVPDDAPPRGPRNEDCDKRPRMK